MLLRGVLIHTCNTVGMLIDTCSTVGMLIHTCSAVGSARDTPSAGQSERLSATSAYSTTSARPVAAPAWVDARCTGARQGAARKLRSVRMRGTCA